MAGLTRIIVPESRGGILLATGLITTESLFNNGLQQNSLALYDLFESIGYTCYCLAEASGASVKGYRFLQPEEFLAQKGLTGVMWYIEIGLSLDVPWRRAIQQAGGQTAKLYLGNVMNIDVETVHMTPGLSFPHHVRGALDHIWTSPHYGQNLAYLSALHRVPAAVVPYVWDDRWLLSLSPPKWRPAADWRDTDLVVSEPNISFQKNALYPVLLALAFRKQWPEWRGRIYVHNAKLLMANPFWKGWDVVFRERLTIGALMAEHPSAVFLQHQYNNEYNYMTLELLAQGFPVLHNSMSWDAGYRWNVDAFEVAVGTLRIAMEHKRGGNALADRFSIRHPRVIADWATLLQSPRPHRIAWGSS